jgi:hypothetical protein
MSDCRLCRDLGSDNATITAKTLKREKVAAAKYE